MLINELRERIKKYTEEELRYIIAEMYKAIPKKIKEENNFDLIISDFHSYKQNGITNKAEQIINFIQLKNDIEQFYSLALSGNYFAPNRIVSKTERSKWRFKVKAFIKNLEAFKITSNEGKEIARLYEMLFAVLSTACGVYLFSSEDPFRAIGITQPDFLDMVFIRKYAYGINEENIRSGIEIVIKSEVDRDTLPSYFIHIFIKYMKTNEAKMIAIEKCKEIQEKLFEQSKDKKINSLEYKQAEKVNRLTELFFCICTELKEYENGISYFKKNYIESNKEVLLFILLKLIFMYELKEIWIKEYKLAINNGIKPRDSLQKIYNHVINKGTFPDSFY